MIEKLKKWGKQVVPSGLILGITFGAYYLIGNRDAIDFALTIAIVGIAIGAKLMINQHTAIWANHLLNSLALYMVYIHIVVLFTFFAGFIGRTETLSLELTWVCTGTFGILMAPVILLLLAKSKCRQASTYVITIIFSVIIFTVYRLFKNDTYLHTYIKLQTLLVIIPNSIYLFYIPNKYKRELGEARPDFICYALFKMLEFAIIFIMRKSPHYLVMIFATHGIEAYYLFRCTLNVCIEGPLTKKRSMLTRAQDMIESHDRNCRMIVNLSHELKTPINVIRSATELLLLEEKDDQTLTQDISDLRKNCNKAMNVIQNMIDIQKMNSKDMIPKMHIYNIIEVVENVIEVISEAYPKSTLIFNTEIEELYAKIDSHLVQQALMQAIVMMLGWDNQLDIYFEASLQNEDRIEIKIMHSKVMRLGKLLEQLKTTYHEENTEDQLVVQYMRSVLKLHQGGMKYVEAEDGDYIVIQLPSQDCTIEEADLLEENIEELKEMIKCGHLILS